MLESMRTPFHSMQHHRDRGLIKGLQVCCLEVVTEIENSLSQTQKLKMYRNKIALEALVSFNCSMSPSNETAHTIFFPVYMLVFSTVNSCPIPMCLNISHSLSPFYSSVKFQREMLFPSTLHIYKQ